MKTISVYMAADGSLHKTREEAVISEIKHAISGDRSWSAKGILDKSDILLAIFDQIDSRSYIPVHFPPMPELPPLPEPAIEPPLSPEAPTAE